MPDLTPNAASPLSEERVREYAQMLAAVTPGPWMAGGIFFRGVGGTATQNIWGPRRSDTDSSGHLVAEKALMADARFIAASPTMAREFIDGYRALLADRTALTARLEAVERERDAEREKAAKVCESRAESLPPIEANEARKCARAIRAKGFGSPFRPARVAERADPAKPRMFPIMHGPEIPWSAIAPFEDQAKRNHCGQTLNELAARGGLSPREALCVMHRVRWDSSEESNRIAALSHADACRELQQLAAAMTASRS